LFVLSRKRGQLFQTSRALKASANTADANTADANIER